MAADVFAHPSKKRKLSVASIKLIQDAERSHVTESGLEALSEKSNEVWVIRLPKNVSNAGRAQVVILVDVSVLDGKEICLNGSHQRVLSEEKEYEVSSTLTPASSNCLPTLLVPSSKLGKLKSVSQVHRQVSVVETVEIPEVKLPPSISSHDKVAMPQGLKLRWKPFGWGKPFSMDEEKIPDKTSSKKHKKEKKTTKHTSD